ncbi:MAG: radical SAM protein [Oscillospiraceae bacterium]|jgi:MoaA/NifB/PqqE/SkfB family radical SAM enzyme|nr:radical SAM protein [Oscillospiraceae bacterium]
MSVVSNLFAGEIRVSLKTAAGILTAYPASAAALTKIAAALPKAERRRETSAKNGADVPPLLIVSTTEECNLSCKGCYACERGEKRGALPSDRVYEVLDEASELGVSVVLLAGGEPLLSHDWLNAMSKQDSMLGLVFTNGTLLDKRRLAWFAENRHLIPLLSIDGNAAQTDARRGEGVYAKVSEAMSALRSSGIPFGVSVAVTGENMGETLNSGFTEEYMQKGCRLFVYVEYVPAEAGTEALVLSKEDKRRLSDFAAQSMKEYAALFVAFPGDEEPYGGCLAAGRGFVHIGADGSLEPCPFAPFSDVSLKNTSLKDALNSALLAKVRENHHLLIEGEGGCALWRKRELLTELTQE